MNFDHLIEITRLLVSHQKEKENLKGETFNIFSILGMESNENKTHSAFLSSLLDPNGTHKKGNIFLIHFLNTIKAEKCQIDLDEKSVIVKTEHFIGARDDIDKMGGRIDIFLHDNFGKMLLIENKIYAIDQFAQIERYCKYNKENNKVFYLNLKGDPPSINSKGNLVVDKDYYIISYKKHILEWLHQCFKDAVDIPILRETIKQYIILIKKLTLTMNNEEEKELFDVILNNYEEASILSANLNKAVNSLGEPIRQKVLQKLQEKFNDKYDFRFAGSFNGRDHTMIIIAIKGKEDRKLLFGLQSFGNETNEPIQGIFIGIYLWGAIYKDEYKSLGKRDHNLWVEVQPIEDYEGFKVSFNNNRTLKKLHSDPVFQGRFIDHIVTKVKQYLDEHHQLVSSLLQNS